MNEHATKNLEQPTSSREGRCVNCNYDLRGLPNGACPECGREFDWDDPSSFLSTDHYVGTVFWLPAILFCGVVIIAGMMFTEVFFHDDASGFFLGLIAAPGCLYAYSHRISTYFFVAVGVMLLGVLAAAFFVSINSPAVAAILAFTAFIVMPYSFGVIVGCLLRRTLKRIPFAMRGHLPAIAGTGVFLYMNLVPHGPTGVG